MLSKIGQTLKKFKHVIQHIGNIIRNEFSKKNQPELIAHDEQITITNENTRVNLVKTIKGVNESGIGDGELSSQHIIAKMNHVPSEPSQQTITSVSPPIVLSVPTNAKPIERKTTPTKTIEDFKFVRHSPAEETNKKVKDDEYMRKTMLELQEELSNALKHWKWTQHAFEQALGFEQVEYSIYQMMAAEHKYRMILLKARELQVEWSKVKGDLV